MTDTSKSLLSTASAELQALLGYGDGDVFGLSCLSVCGPSSDKKSMRQLISLQRAGQPGATKLLCYKRDGTPFWSVLLHVSFVHKLHTAHSME